MSETSAEEEPEASRSSQGTARAKRREETRERLFEMALREFREQGLAGAQIDRIAKAAGVVRGTFYFHFPSKEDVMMEFARRIDDRATRQVAGLSSDGQSLRDTLLCVHDAIIDAHRRVGEAGLAADLAALYAREPRGSQGHGGQGFSSLIGWLIARFGQMRARGEIRSPVADELAAIVFLTSVFGVFVRNPPGEQRREACLALIDLFVVGLTAGTSLPKSGA